MANNLLTPILEGGIRSTNFFNGRLLSGEDLSQEQLANRDARRQLGKALGDGVAYGLVVTKSSDSTPVQPIVSVSSGLAINRRGQTLTLPTKTDISLVRSLDSSDSTGKTFADCRPVNPDIYVAGPGAYVLLMCPAKGSEGRAPMSGLGNIPAPCNTKYLIDGIQFRLLKLDIDDEDLSDTVRLRNRLAYKCFGVDDSSYVGWWTDPFGDHDTTYGLLDSLRPKILTECDVPLALMYWTSTDGVVFVDMWSVRRNATTPGSNEDVLPVTTPRRQSEGEAMFRQFIEEAADILEANTCSAYDVDDFSFLPPIGLLPVSGSGSAKGFDPARFFASRGSGTPTVIGQNELITLMRKRICYPPIDVQKMDVIQLYWVRENLLAVQSGDAEQLFLIFATRDSGDFRETDDVSLVIGQAWKSYSDLLKKAVLLPDTVDSNSLALWTGVWTAQLNIIQYAIANEPLVSAGATRATVLSVFSRLLALQEELPKAAILTFNGDDGLSQRQVFADRLLALLDGKRTGDKPGLKLSLSSDSFQDVVAAQREINTFISSFSGEVASGSLQIRNTGSPRGNKLVPGDAQAYPYPIEVVNRMDKRVSIKLSASVTVSQSGTWGDAVTIKDSNGSILSEISLDPDQTSSFTVNVTAPEDAAKGQDIRIQIVAAVPPPTDKSFPLNLDLTTAAEAGGEIAWSLKPIAVQQASGRTNAQPGLTYPFIFSTEFLASRAPMSTQCTLIAVFTFAASARSDWDVHIDNVSAVESPSGTLQYTFQLPAVDGAGKERTTISVVAPATRDATNDKVCQFTIETQTSIIDPNTGATVQVKSTIDETFAVTLKKTS
jgi:hypothetical protein